VGKWLWGNQQNSWKKHGKKMSKRKPYGGFQSMGVSPNPPVVKISMGFPLDFQLVGYHDFRTPHKHPRRWG